MSHSETEKILHHPEFRRLVQARNFASVLFSLLVMIGYGIYVMGMAYAPALMSRPVTQGGSMTYGILIAVMVIVMGVVTSGLYSWWAKIKIDRIKQLLLKDLGL